MMAHQPFAEFHNRFVDLMLVVGIDDSTGLILVDKDQEVSIFSKRIKVFLFVRE